MQGARMLGWVVAAAVVWPQGPVLAQAGVAPSPVAAPQAPGAAPACTDLSCRRLGWSFYLPERNLLSVAAQHGGKPFLVHLDQDGCTTVSTPAPGRPSLKLINGPSDLVANIAQAAGLDASEATNLLSTQASVAFLARPDGSAGAPVAGFRSVQVEVTAIARTIDVDPSPRCIQESRLDPDVVRQLERLALVDPKAVALAASWDPYAEFLRSVGSHVVIQQQLGSRLLHWESTAADGRTGAADLVAKACVALEGLEGPEGWLVDDCRRYPNRDRGPARAIVSASQHLVQGGSKSMRLALQAPGPLKAATLRAFIASAGQADQAAGLAYLPVWRVLESIYGPACAAAGSGSPACQHLQRALALQATYEARLAIGCEQLKAQGFTYQQMAVAATSALGIDTYQCLLAKTGCRSNASCHLYWAKCFCHGPDCIAPSALAPGVTPPVWLNGIRGGRAGGYREGENNACHYQAGAAECQCNPGWDGGLPERAVYKQPAH